MRAAPSALMMLLAATPASAQPDKLELAKRLVADIGGFDTIARLGVQTMLDSGAIKSPDLYRKVYRQYLDDHPDLIAKGNQAMASTFAGIYTEQEWTRYLSYEESPAGRAILQKRQEASETMLSGHYVPAQLSPEEKAAEDGFYASPEGKTINQKFAQGLVMFLTAVTPYFQQIGSEAVSEYCKEGGDCSNLAVRPMTDPPQQH